MRTGLPEPSSGTDRTGHGASSVTLLGEFGASSCELPWELEKFLGKDADFDLSFMDRSITGRVKEVGQDFLLLEMRDGRHSYARIDCVLGFGMVKNQAEAV